MSEYKKPLIRARYLLRGWKKGYPRKHRGIIRKLEADGFDSGGMIERADNSLAERIALLLVSVQTLFGNSDQPIGDDELEGLIRTLRRSVALTSQQIEELVDQLSKQTFRVTASAHDAGLAAMAAAAGIAFPFTTAARIDEMRARSARRRSASGGIPPDQLTRIPFRGFVEGVDMFIRQNRGMPRREAGQRVLAVFAKYEKVGRALEQIGPRGESVRRSVVRAGRAAETIDHPARNLYANARRILIHEINSAFHEADALSAAESPAVDLVKWSTSDRHDSLPSSPDICDVLEDIDLHNFGPGIYYPETVPSLPHPHCQDYITPILRPVPDWSKPKRDPVLPRAVGVEEVRTALNARRSQNSGTLTKSFVNRTKQEANRAWQVAHDAFVDY